MSDIPGNNEPITSRPFFMVTNETVLVCREIRPATDKVEYKGDVECCVISSNNGKPLVQPKGHNIFFPSESFLSVMKKQSIDLRKTYAVSGVRRHADDFNFETGDLKKEIRCQQQ